MSENNDIQATGVYSPEVIEFVKAANDYCSWLEDEEPQQGRDFIQSAVKMLSKVYYLAVSIEPFEPVMEGGNEKFVTEQDWSMVYQKVMNSLGRFNSYLRIAEDGEFDRSDLVQQKISEDVADIFQDLKDFIMQYRQGVEEIMNDAVWEVLDNMEQYWSAKLLNALLALNKLYVSKTDPENDEGPALDDQSEEEDIPGYDNSFFTRMQDLNEEDI